VIRFHSDVALLKVDEKDCFVFSFGCLVCWGCTPQEVNAARDSVKNFLKEPLTSTQVEIDHLNIAGGDALPACHKVQERIAIAYSLAQSVRLSFWEQRIDEWIAATRNIPEDMARTGRVLLSSQHVAKMMGELFALKNQVNLEFDTLDTPDVFWEFEEAEPIYVYARQHLDVDRRIHIVNHRFEVLEDMFDVLKDKLDERQGSRLTWIIIWLCALETVFSALKIIWTAGLLPAVKDAAHWLLESASWSNGTVPSNTSSLASMQTRPASIQEAPRDYIFVLPILGTLGATWPPPRCFLEDDEGEVLTSDKELAEAMEGKSVPALVLRCLHAALRCPQGYSTASDAALAALLEQLLSISLTADCHAALAFLREAALLLRRHRRLYSLLDVEGGIFGLGGVADKSVTLAWYFQGISCSLSPVLASAAQALPSSIPKRNEVIADLFPFKDSHQWLAGEVVRHFGAAEDIPKQTSRRSKLASFVSESELRATCE
ncbi:RMD1, partial [Symbiodinium necroappetens]